MYIYIYIYTIIPNYVTSIQSLHNTAALDLEPLPSSATIPSAIVLLTGFR